MRFEYDLTYIYWCQNSICSISDETMVQNVNNSFFEVAEKAFLVKTFSFAEISYLLLSSTHTEIPIAASIPWITEINEDIIDADILKLKMVWNQNFFCFNLVDVKTNDINIKTASNFQIKVDYRSLHKLVCFATLIYNLYNSLKNLYLVEFYQKIHCIMFDFAHVLFNINKYYFEYFNKELQRPFIEYSFKNMLQFTEIFFDYYKMI